MGGGLDYTSHTDSKGQSKELVSQVSAQLRKIAADASGLQDHST